MPVGRDAVELLKLQDRLICFAFNVKKSSKCNHSLLFIAFNFRNLTKRERESSHIVQSVQVKAKSEMQAAESVFNLPVCPY